MAVPLDIHKRRNLLFALDVLHDMWHDEENFDFSDAELNAIKWGMKAIQMVLNDEAEIATKIYEFRKR